MNFSESQSSYDQIGSPSNTPKPLTLDWIIGHGSNKLIIKIINIEINGGREGWVSLGGEQFKRYRSIGYYHSVNNSDRVPIVSLRRDGLKSLNKFFVSNGTMAHVVATFILIGC